MRFWSYIVSIWDLIRNFVFPSKFSTVSPKLGKVAGKIVVTQKSGAPESIHAIVEVEVIDFNPGNPPEIKTFDDTKGVSAQPLETTVFAPGTNAPYTCKIPVFLAYDKDPWSRPNKEPEERTTRIEVHHNSLNQPLKAYVKLKSGIFVVPVFWHNIVNAGSKCYVDPLDVRDLFWTVKKAPEDYYDVNSIWAQAGVQFRLMNTGIPFSISSIPTHYVQPPDYSKVKDCTVFWKQDYNYGDAADIYAIDEVIFQGNPAAGIGNCRNEGFVFIAAGNPTSPKTTFTDHNVGMDGRAELVAHEFGHFLGSLPHTKNAAEYNLMYELGAAGPKLTQEQINLVRERIRDHRFTL